MASAFWDTEDDACFVDCGVTYSFTTPTATLINLRHLEGRNVVAIADRAVVKNLIVAGGKVTLPTPASRVTIGLPYTATIETLPLAKQTREGWTLAKPQQAVKVALRVKDSRGFLVGPSEDKLEAPRPRSNELPSVPPSLRTGIVSSVLSPHIRSDDRGDAGVTVVIQSSDPLPLTVTEVLYDPSASQ
jgi:hypothetical protein